MNKFTNQRNRLLYPYLLALLVIGGFCTTSTRAQGSGPTVVTAGQTATYTYNNGYWTRGWNWTVTSQGTIQSTSQSGTTYSCVIYWGTTGTGTVQFRQYSTVKWSTNVTINCTPPATPSAPSGPSSSCTKVIKTRGTPPSGVTWYWQGTNSNGTSTSNSATTYQATSTGTYYLRARKNTGCWGGSVGFSITIYGVPGTPSTPSASSNTCGNKTLTRGTPPSGVTWYWQGTNSSGTSTSNSASTYIASSSGTYYLRARKNSGGCWSGFSSSVAVTINAYPSTPAAPSGPSSNCTKVIKTRGTPPSGVTWYWQGTNSNGTSTSNSSTSYNITSTGTYYLRARTTAGCWSSSSVGFSATIYGLPTSPGIPNISSNTCGNKILTRSSPPANVTWYWQGTNSSGTSTSNSSTTYTVSA